MIRTKRKQVRLSFRFGSSEKNSAYLCKVDQGRFHGCPAKLSKSFKIGRHSVAVEAVDATGNVGRPATFSFKVVKVVRIKPRIGHHKKHHRS